MGAYERTKGQIFERKIAKVFRDVFPTAMVRRTVQSDGPYESDLIIEGKVPKFLHQLWWECNDQKKCYPEVKLHQAIRDSNAARERTQRKRYPVVVWHEKHRRDIWATMRLCDLIAIQYKGANSPLSGLATQISTTLKLGDFLFLLQELYGQ
jgi:hypothetical protein